MIFLKRPYLPSEGGKAKSTHLRDVAEDADVSFNPQSIIYIQRAGWVGYKDAPNLPDPAQDALSDVFSDKFGLEVRFATEDENEQLIAWVEADPDDRQDITLPR